MSAPRKTKFVLSLLAGVLTACATPGPTTAPSSTADDSAKPVVVALTNDAQQAQRQGRYVQAVAYLERALRIEPNNSGLWHRLASVRYAQGRYQQAVHMAAKSNSLAGTNHDLQRRNWLLMAEAWTALGRTDKADAARRNAEN